MIRSGEEIQSGVLADLKWDAQVAANEIGVAVKDEVVTLAGWVDSFIKSRGRRTRGAPGVKDRCERRRGAPARFRTEAGPQYGRRGSRDAFVPIENLDVTVSKGG